jgi:hypothetical protein
MVGPYAWRAAALAICLVAVPAAAQPFAPFLGSWNGSGKVVINDGRTEQIKCSGYYRSSETSNTFGVSLRCASPSYSIQLRSNLSVAGSQVSGSWEERTFNLQGHVTGRIDSGRITVSIHGGPFNAAMSIAVAGSSQAVVLTAQGSGLKEVRMTLSRAQ